jgi:uncharacterized protein
MKQFATGERSEPVASVAPLAATTPRYAVREWISPVAKPATCVCVYTPVYYSMRFSWDPAKNARNIRERGLAFEEAAPMWEGPMLVWTDTRRDYGEVREIGLGQVGARVMVVGWVRRGEEHFHIFSFRKANARETKRYQAALAAEGG